MSFWGDLAWLWPVEETMRKTARTYANQLALMEEYPDYRFLLCEPPILEYLKTLYPDVYRRVKERTRLEQRLVPAPQQGRLYRDLGLRGLGHRLLIGTHRARALLKPSKAGLFPFSRGPGGGRSGSTGGSTPRPSFRRRWRESGPSKPAGAANTGPPPLRWR